MSDLIDQVVEIAEDADLETTVMEPVKKWVLDKKSAIIGAVAGAGATFGVTKLVEKAKAKKAAAADEQQDKVSLIDGIKNKLGKKAAEKLDEIEAADEDDFEEDVEDDVEE